MLNEMLWKKLMLFMRIIPFFLNHFYPNEGRLNCPCQGHVISAAFVVGWLLTGLQLGAMLCFPRKLCIKKKKKKNTSLPKINIQVKDKSCWCDMRWIWMLLNTIYLCIYMLCACHDSGLNFFLWVFYDIFFR